VLQLPGKILLTATVEPENMFDNITCMRLTSDNSLGIHKMMLAFHRCFCTMGYNKAIIQ